MCEPVKRVRRGSRQRERSAATRARIREAAGRLFVQRGYPATTIESIAVEADVAVQTVYFVFGNKRALLSEVLDIAIAGDDAPVPLLERPWVAELRQEADPRQAVRLLVHQSSQIVGRQAPLAQALRGAAAVDPEIAGLLAVYQERRLATMTELLRPLAARGALAPDLDLTRAADLVYALSSHELYQLLVVDRGWSPTAWEVWLAELLIDQLLG